MGRSMRDYGKKIDTFRVSSAVRPHVFNLYFDQSKCRFATQVGDEVIVEKDFEALKKKVKALVEQLDETRWTRMIEYDYSPASSYGNRGGTRHGGEVDDFDLVVGFTIQWRVVDVGDLLPVPGSQGQMSRLVRNVDFVGGELVPADETQRREIVHGGRDLECRVPFTPHRLKVFREVSEGIIRLHEILRSVLTRDAEKTAIMLDGVKGVLLPAPGLIDDAALSGRCCSSPDDGHLVGCKNWIRR